MSKSLTIIATALMALLLIVNADADNRHVTDAGDQTATESESLPDPLQAGWEGNPVCENIFEDEQQRTLRCTFPPGGGHDRHYHRPHFGYALSGGKMRLIDANGVREVELPTDTSFSSDGVEWHEVINIGTTTVRYLIVEQK